MSNPRSEIPFGQGAGNNYTQVNVMFPSEQVELPDAQKFKEFPPEAQKVILEAFTKEQADRHRWLATQQSNEHQFNMQCGRHYFIWRMAGVVGGVVLAIAALLIGAWLVVNHASAAGLAVLFSAIAVLVGTAVYGHRAKQVSQTAREQQPASNAVQPNAETSPEQTA